MAKPGWWDVHRLLQPGSRGPDVEELQRQLMTVTAKPVDPNGRFDDKTEDAVREFQRLNGLVEDGMVGVLTHCLLFSSNYQFSVSWHTLPVTQPAATCWAASLESVLFTSWGIGRTRQTVDDLLKAYSWRGFFRGPALGA